MPSIESPARADDNTSAGRPDDEAGEDVRRAASTRLTGSASPHQLTPLQSTVGTASWMRPLLATSEGASRPSALPVAVEPPAGQPGEIEHPAPAVPRMGSA